jgi:hypothetical protein
VAAANANRNARRAVTSSVNASLLPHAAGE